MCISRSLYYIYVLVCVLLSIKYIVNTTYQYGDFIRFFHWNSVILHFQNHLTINNYIYESAQRTDIA